MEAEGVVCHVLKLPQPKLVSDSTRLVVTESDGGLVVELPDVGLSATLAHNTPVVTGSARKLVMYGKKMFLGLTFPEDKGEEFQTLTGLLRTHCRFVELDLEVEDAAGGSQAAAPESAQKVASGLENASEKVAVHIVKGAAVAGKGIKQGAHKTVQGTAPGRKPVQLSSRTLRAIDKLQAVSGSFKNKSAVVAGAVSAVSHKVVAKGIDGASNAAAKSGHGNSKVVAGSAEIVLAAVVAMATLYEGLEEASAILWQDSLEATLEVVQHKHGEEAADAVERVAEAVEDLNEAMGNLAVLDPAEALKEGAVEYAKRGREGKGARGEGEAAE